MEISLSREINLLSKSPILFFDQGKLINYHQKNPNLWHDKFLAGLQLQLIALIVMKSDLGDSMIQVLGEKGFFVCILILAKEILVTPLTLLCM